MNLEIGLFLIAFSWLIQLYELVKGKKELSLLFVIVYTLGVFFLMADAFAQNHMIGALFQAFALITAGAVLIKLLFFK